VRVVLKNTVNGISPSTSSSWINIFADPGITFQSDLSLQFMSSLSLQPGLDECYSPIILG